MVDEEAGNAQPAVAEPDGTVSGPDAIPKAPGWYPDRANPNDQSYWDGQSWTAKRRWTSGKGWIVAGDAPNDVMRDASPSRSGPRHSANPYAGAFPSRPKAAGFSFNLGVFLLLVCGVALMYGSVGAWVHVSGNVGVANFHASLNGTDPGITNLIRVNGWVTFIGGVLVVIFACFAMTSEELQPAIFTVIITFVTAVFAAYDMFRIVQKISQVPASAGANISVGWGLICVLSAAVLALLIAIVKLIQI